MSIRVALHHHTRYRYDRHVQIFPQVVRLRPAPHCRTPILSYSLKVRPEKHFINWQQDPHGNFLGRLVFPEKSNIFDVEVDLVAEMTVINPFDFFLEESAEKAPFVYEPHLMEELRPNLVVQPMGRRLAEFLGTIDREPKRTIDFLVDITHMLQAEIARPIIFYGRAAGCWQPQVRNITLHVNSIYNNWRFDDVWLER